jgi:hypothetical protein
MQQQSLARCAVALGLLCAAWAWPGRAWADEHALILWIGEYADPQVRIIGLEHDAALARSMAQALGVPDANRLERSNAQLTHSGLKNALADLRARVRPGDGVFVYFSGHGRQVQRLSGGPGCSEGLATFEGGIYFDLLLRDELDALAQRASRVVMFNDSCFSGGAASKSFEPGELAEAAPKVYPPGLESEAQADAQYYPKSLPGVGATDSASANASCGVHVNPVSKAFGGLAQSPRQHGVLYLAGSAANEAAYPTPQGSVATRAWAACLQDPGTASNNNSAGVLTGAALSGCANAWIKRHTRYRQTITLVGNGQLPLRRF